MGTITREYCLYRASRHICGESLDVVGSAARAPRVLKKPATTRPAKAMDRFMVIS
jgi:hypothetical protein